MALPEQDKLILVAVLAVVMVLVLLFELKFMRRKSVEVRRASLKKDEAFNAMHTTRSVLTVRQRQGQDVSTASRILRAAEEAYEDGHYNRCKDLCERSRGELITPSSSESSGPKSEGDELEHVAKRILNEPSSPKEPDDYKGAKLSSSKEGNYLGAKFEISRAKSEMSQASRTGVDLTDAESLIDEADAAYSLGNYDKAMSCAVKARKSISSEAEKETIKLTSRRKEAEPPPSGFEEEPSEVLPEEPAKARMARCEICEEPLEREDMFCAKCGAKVETDVTCSSCGTKTRPGDVFCRKCGADLR